MKTAMKTMGLVLLFALLLEGLALAGSRVAVVVGNNLGEPRDLPLRFAAEDARRVARVLRELGGVRGEDLYLVLDRDAAAVRKALDQALDKTARAEGSLLFFYYSGHADSEALHLGGTRLPWVELKQKLDSERPGLRVALVDACQSGTLTALKGFALDRPLEVQAPTATGYAVLVSSGSGEAAQESLSLGGSFFSHFLVSGLRGAADTDGDGRVTLSEANAYTTKHTREATSTWAREIQHPSFLFDISGHGEVVLADLREGSATLVFPKGVEGHLVVTERGSSWVLVEADKEAGRKLALALPAGRYLVHLRQPKAIFLEEVSLPWGGAVEIAEGDMSRQSYRSVAQKGTRLEVYRHRVHVEGTLQSRIVPGMGASGLTGIGYGFRLSPWEVGLRAEQGSKGFDAEDTFIQTEFYGASALLAYERPVGIVDLVCRASLGAQLWKQYVKRERDRTSVVPEASLGLGVRIPLFARLFAEATLEGRFYLPNEQDVGPVVRPALGTSLAVGWSF